MTTRLTVSGCAILAVLWLARDAAAAPGGDLAKRFSTCALGPVGFAGGAPSDPFGGSLFEAILPLREDCSARGSFLSLSPLLGQPGWRAHPDAVTAPPIAGPGRLGQPSAAPSGPLWGFISELRGGILSHDVFFPSTRDFSTPNPFRHHFERGVNLNGEVLFVSPGFLSVIGSPRPRVGFSVNTLGYTSNAYVDLDWGYQFAAGLFVEGFFGGAVHDGKLFDGNPRFAELGSRALFHLGLETGWRFGHHGFSLFWEHMSNSALAAKNQGMDSAGLRYGYRFDG